MMTRPCNYSFL